MANVRRYIRGSVPGEAVPLLHDRELIKDSDTGDVYIGHNGSNKLISGDGTLSALVIALQNDKLNAADVSSESAPNKVARRDANGDMPGNLTGTAATATKLSTVRTVSITGGATAEGEFDGSADLSLTLTVDPDQHAHALTDLTGFPDLSAAEGKILRVVDGALVTDVEATPANVYTKTEVDAIAQGKAASTHSHDDLYFTEAEVTNALAGKAAANHTHDGRYLTGDDVDARISGKANTGHTHAELAAADHDHDSEYSDAGHTHDDRYYTEQEVTSRLDNLQPTFDLLVQSAARSASYASVSEENAFASAVTAAHRAIEASNNGAAQVVLAAEQAAISLSHSDTASSYAGMAAASADIATNRASYAEAQAVLAAEIKDFILTLQSAVGNVDGGNSLSVYTAQQVINGGDSNG